jgi:hypothetical protein
MTTAQITIKADDENNAETFWAALDQQYPAVAKALRESGEIAVTPELFGSLKQLPGFSDGPSYAPTALVEA